MHKSRNRHRNFDAQDSHGRTGNFLSNIVKGFAFAIVALTLAAIGYNMAPQQSKDIVNKVTSAAHETTVKAITKVKGESGAVSSVNNENVVFDNNLDPSKKIQIDSVTISNDGTGTMSYQNHKYNIHLAGISLLPIDSEFMQKYGKRVNALLTKTIQGDKDKKVTLAVKRPKQTVGPQGSTGIYLFVNGKMLQQTLLEDGLAYITVSKGSDGASSTIYSAQTSAQQQKNNIWQVNGAVVQNGDQGFKFNAQAERDYMDSKGQKVTFDESKTGKNVVSKVIGFFK